MNIFIPQLSYKQQLSAVSEHAAARSNAAPAGNRLPAAIVMISKCQTFCPLSLHRPSQCTRYGWLQSWKAVCFCECLKLH